LRQEVNLLPAGSGRPRTRPFTHYLAAAVVALLLVVAAGAALLAVQLDRVAASGALLAERTAVNERELAQLRRRAATHQADPDLLARVERRQEELAARHALRQALAENRLGNSAGFSPVITGLAQQVPEALWLRVITLADGGRQLDLQGSALDPAAVPAYLQRFSNDAALAGRQVHRLEITQPGTELKHVDFSVSSERRP
jgi:Tfp pilus assembly protein PilN